MREIKFKAIIHFNTKEKMLEAKTEDEAEREAQDWSCQFEDVGLIDVEEIYKDKDSCDEHFNIVSNCEDCKKKFKRNMELLK